MGFAPAVQLAVPVGLGPVLKRPIQPILGEAPLDAEHRALGHIHNGVQSRHTIDGLNGGYCRPQSCLSIGDNRAVMGSTR